MNHVKLIFPAILAAYLCGCAVTVPASSKKELEYSADRRFDQIFFDGNYLSLAKCWEVTGEKFSINFNNASHVEYFLDEKRIEIYHAWANIFDKKLFYGSIIYLSPSEDGKTVAKAFGVGYSGNYVLPKWLATLDSCGRK